jgi:hypothetical protein
LSEITGLGDNMQKEIIIYMRSVYVGQPTEIDKKGCDGLYLKECKPVTSDNSKCDATPALKLPSLNDVLKTLIRYNGSITPECVYRVIKELGNFT